jgi:hypothetical protein
VDNPTNTPAGHIGGTRWNFNRVTALALAAIAAALLAAVPYQIAAQRTAFGRSLTGLNPALFPRLVLGAMLALAIAYFFLSPRLNEPNLLRRVPPRGFVDVAATVLCLLAYTIALPELGFVVSGATLMVVLALFYGNRSHLLTIATAVLVPTAIYFGFTRLLRVSLPEFPFF